MVQKSAKLSQLEKRCGEMQSADRAEYEHKLFASRDKSQIFDKFSERPNTSESRLAGDEIECYWGPCASWIVQ